MRASSCAFSSLLSGVDGVGGDGKSVLKEGDFCTALLDSLGDRVLGVLLVLLARFSAGDGAPKLALLVVVGFIGCSEGAAGALPACLIGADAGLFDATTLVCIFGILGMLLGSSRSPHPSSSSNAVLVVSLAGADISASKGDGDGLVPPSFIPPDDAGLLI